MANYLATDTEFTRVANAIRTKGGTSAQLAWPDEFISAIMAIPTDGKTYVDVCLFAGQSNMDGRGDSSEAPTVATGTAYKWDASTNTVVDFVAEGSLIPAFVKTMYEATGVPVVEVKRAVGGVDISNYITNYLSLACRDLSNCIDYLENDNKTIRHVFVLWNQGESDVENGTTEAQYETYFDQVRTAVFAAGATDFFIINIGQADSGNFDFTPIRTALQDVCNGTNTVIVSDKFYNAPMKGGLDRWHYNQPVYNVVGQDAAQNVFRFFSGETLKIVPFNAADVYGEPDEYGTLDDWTYELTGIKVYLKGYTGTDPDVRVYRFYKIGDMYYEARIKRGVSLSDQGAFAGNTTIETVAIDSGVLLMFKNSSGDYSDDSAQQQMQRAFRGATSLQSVSWTDAPTFANMVNCFENCTALTSIDFWSNIRGDCTAAFKATGLATANNFSCGTASNAFQNCASLASVGDITIGSANAWYMFSGCSNLVSIGAIKGTSLTDMRYMFNNCRKLAGDVRIESPNVTNCPYAFNAVDLTKITIYVPANSTTYDTIIAAYPSANIVTFTAA